MEEFHNHLDQLRHAVLNDPGNRKENFARIMDQIEAHVHIIGSEGGIDEMNLSNFPNATNAEKNAYTDIYVFLSDFYDTLDLADLGDALMEFRESVQESLNAQPQQNGGVARRSRSQTKRRRGGANCRIGVMNPLFGGKRRKTRKTRKSQKALKNRRGGGCGCGAPKPQIPLPEGVSLGPLTAGLMKGGACPCQAVAPMPAPLVGGYKPTKRNLKYLKRWKQGKSVGFTMRSSLKAKGLIPRANGTKKVSSKYRR
jgi:hypothetical protein